MPALNSRYQFSHPDIPIDLHRLREVIAAGDAAEAAQSAQSMRLIAAHASNDPTLAQGFDEVSRINSEIAATRQRRRQLQADRKDTGSIDAAMADLLRRMSEAQRLASDEADMRHRAINQRRRCIEYCLERGFTPPDVLARLDGEGRAR